MIRLAIRELQKSIFINLLVVIQSAVLIVIMLIAETAAQSRITYYLPIRDYVSTEGCVCYFEKVRPIIPEEFEKELKGKATVSMSYKLFSELISCTVQVFDDDMLAHYSPQLKTGSWNNKPDQADIIFAVAYESSGYQINDELSVMTETGEKKIQISGIMEDSTLVWGFTYSYVTQNDFRMLYHNSKEFVNKNMVFISNSEADKLDGIKIASGLAFIQYHEPLSNNDSIENTKIISTYGVDYQIDNATVRNNSLQYVYEQFRMLFPVILCVAILLFISVICSNAVYAMKEQRNHDIYAIVGLTKCKCLHISILKSFLITVVSLLIVIVFLILKPHFSALNTYLIELHKEQIITLIILGLINEFTALIVTCAVTRTHKI